MVSPSSAPYPAQASKARGPLATLILLATVLAIYAPTLWQGFILLDDPGYVTGNQHVRAGLTWAGFCWAWTTFYQANWHPLTWLSLMLDSHLYGQRAGGYHLTNLLLHAASTLLLFRWLRVTTKAFWLSALTAFFFAAHPMRVESVAWVSERKDVLCLFFFCLTLLAYSRYAWSGSGRMRYFWLAWAFYALGLLAKPMLVTLPALLLLLDYWPLHRFPAAALRDHWRRLAVEKLPFVALAGASCVVTFLAQRSQAVVPYENLPLVSRLASAVLGVCAYVVKTFWPVNLGVYYPYWHGVPPWLPVACGVLLVMATVGAIWRWRQQPYLTVGWLWFLGALVPVAGLVQVGGQAIADRYTYLPHVGLFIAVLWSGRACADRWPRARRWLVGLVVFAAVGCLGLSVRQVSFWQSDAALFGHALSIERQPTPRMYRLYADALLQIPGQEARAADAYEKAWRLSPGTRNEDTAAELGRLWLEQGRARDTVGLLDPIAAQPGASVVVLATLGGALLAVGEAGRAETVCRRCVARYPREAGGHFSLADCLRRRGDVAGACDAFETGLIYRKDWPPALTYLAWTYAHLEGDDPAHARALTLAKRAVEVGRGQDLAAYSALASAQAALGKWPQAVDAAQSALTLAERPGASPEVAAACRERLTVYRRGQMP